MYKKNYQNYNFVWNKRYDLVDPMTCIIGARCKNGVLIAGDTQVLRGRSIEQQEKIIKLNEIPVVYAYSGTTALMDNFLKKVQELLILNKKIRNEREDVFKEKLEDIVFQIFNRYTRRTPDHTLDVFVGYKSPEHIAGLYHIYPDGVSENVVFDIIGSGEPYVRPFIDSLYYEDISLNDMTLICFYVLGLMDELRVDVSIGGTPQIVWIKDGTTEDEILQLDYNSVETEIENLKNGKSLSNRLWNIFPPLEEEDK